LDPGEVVSRKIVNEQFDDAVPFSDSPFKEEAKNSLYVQYSTATGNYRKYRI
jgi:hypothetical protein